MLKVLNKFVDSPEVGVALVPYYRQILPVLNMFITHNGTSHDFFVVGHGTLSYVWQ